MRARRQLLLVTLCVLPWLPLGASTQAAAQGRNPRALRVMTYNIKHGQTNAPCAQPRAAPGQPPAPDCNLDLRAAVEVIRAHDPDIVGVQEVDRFWARSARVDGPAVLAEGTGLTHSCYGPNLDHGADSHSDLPHQYGTVILSRFPILDCTNRPLRRTASNEQRGLARALIDVNGVPVQFYNTHLHTTAADRLMQTADIAAVLDAAPAGPKLLVGDFNAVPTAPEMAPIRERLADAWLEAAGSPGDNADGNTSPARLEGSPARRIDYIFVSPDMEVTRAQVPIERRTRLAADHFPVVAEATLP